MKRMRRTLLLSCLAWTCLALASARAGDLPDDPSEWVCKGSDRPVTEAQIRAWCARNERGEEPDFDNEPATLLDLKRKNAYDRELRDFLRNRTYRSLGWTHDKVWRLTGPFVGEIPKPREKSKGMSYGVHPLVRIYYSPEVVNWLCAGRPDDIPDGAMIVKEMTGINTETVRVEDGCMRATSSDIEPSSWTVMVRDKATSADGWYWANPAGEGDGNPPILDKSAVDRTDFFGKFSARNPRWYPTGDLFGKEVQGGRKLADVVYPYNLFGAYCVNCHASAEKLHTYSSMDNIIEEGIGYRHFERETAEGGRTLAASGSQHSEESRAEEVYENPFPAPRSVPSKAFLDFYGKLDQVDFGDVIKHRFPAETFDHHLSGSAGPPRFVTSDQCIGCHDATSSNDGIPHMQIKDAETGEWVNVSPYAEWRASPMGLAGRDPIFFAQLQSETNHLPELAACIESTCLHCHGVMGQRQYAYDTQGEGDGECKKLFGVAPPDAVPFGKPFRREMVKHWQSEPDNAFATYGNLARDGISCAVCHHISAEGLGRENGFTGNFITGPADKIFGPYRDDTVVDKPMEHALGITPRYGAQVASSELCGSCHAILLPKIRNDGELVGYSYEQTTYLEWTNSDFARGESFRSCQDCHMPTRYKSTPLEGTVIANIESDRFPPTTHRLPDKEIELTARDKFSRHALHGLNVFLNQMFQQFPLILGLRQIDYMVKPAVVPGLITGQQSMLRMAGQETADLRITRISKGGGRLEVDVLVTNKTGHYLPSGVGFRRAFLELAVLDAAGREIWVSGTTDELGVILDCRGDGSGGPLACTPLPDETDGRTYQPHHQRITRGDQVQIYQELIADSDGELTTSFLRRITELKDNRLRPKGFDPEVFADDPSPFIRKLDHCKAEEAGEDESCKDPYYRDPALTGADRITYDIDLGGDALDRVARVTVRLLNQSIPPPYLRERFRDAGVGPAETEDIRRLYYLTSHLNTGNGTGEGPGFIKDWKLEITRTCVRVDGSACPAE